MIFLALLVLFRKHSKQILTTSGFTMIDLRWLVFTSSCPVSLWFFSSSFLPEHWCELCMVLARLQLSWLVEITKRECFVISGSTTFLHYWRRCWQLNLVRNSISLGIRCRWGIRNGLFYVAKDSESHRVLGVAMWLPPKSAGSPETWAEWIDSCAMWFQQVGMNIWYGRGGLNVKVSSIVHFTLFL